MVPLLTFEMSTADDAPALGFAAAAPLPLPAPAPAPAPCLLSLFSSPLTALSGLPALSRAFLLGGVRFLALFLFLGLGPRFGLGLLGVLLGVGALRQLDLRSEQANRQTGLRSWRKLCASWQKHFGFAAGRDS